MNKKRESLPYINVGTGPTSRMGMPKPIRMLAGATMLLFVFLVYQMMRNPSVMQPPGSHEKTQDMVRDPNLDRKKRWH